MYAFNLNSPKTTSVSASVSFSPSSDPTLAVSSIVGQLHLRASVRAQNLGTGLAQRTKLQQCNFELDQ